MTVPGVGPVTSLTFKAGVDDADRFRSSRNVAAHFGLTPRRYQSGETDNPGRISKAGDRDVRMALYTAAHALMTRSDAWSTLKAWGLRLAKVRGHRRAVIAVARKLAVILHRMWVDGTDFRAARPPGANELIKSPTLKLVSALTVWTMVLDEAANVRCARPSAPEAWLVQPFRPMPAACQPPPRPTA